MKSERITFLATPEFKANLMQLAAQQNISVGEVIRGRFDTPLHRPTYVERAELRELVSDLREVTAEVQARLREGLAEAEHTLRALREVSVAKDGAQEGPITQRGEGQAAHEVSR